MKLKKLIAAYNIEVNPHDLMAPHTRFINACIEKHLKLFQGFWAHPNWVAPNGVYHCWELNTQGELYLCTDKGKELKVCKSDLLLFVRAVLKGTYVSLQLCYKIVNKFNDATKWGCSQYSVKYNLFKRAIAPPNTKLFVFKELQDAVNYSKTHYMSLICRCITSKLYACPDVVADIGLKCGDRLHHTATEYWNAYNKSKKHKKVFTYSGDKWITPAGTKLCDSLVMLEIV